MGTSERFPTCTGSKGLGDFDFGFSLPGQTSEIFPLRIWPDPPSAIHHRLETHRRRVSTVITQEGKDLRQILVQPFPGPGGHIQISNMSGSSQPRWSRDGRKIFFVQPDRKLMVVAFDPTRKSASAPQVFAQTRIAVTTFGWFQYDVSPDGRLLVNSLPPNNSPLALIAGWDALIRKQ
jgi:hypothetical protein